MKKYRMVLGSFLKGLKVSNMLGALRIGKNMLGALRIGKNMLGVLRIGKSRRARKFLSLYKVRLIASQVSV